MRPIQTRTRAIGGALVVASLVLGSGVTTAAATVSRPQVAKAATSKPGGYLIVSAAFSAPGGSQTGGEAICPVTSSGVQRYPQSGGVFVQSSDLNVNVNSTYPGGTSWHAYVNNATGAPVSFTVYAVCAKPKRGYVLETSGNVSVGANAQAGFTVFCPAGTRILGGGASSPSDSLAENINSSYPVSPPNPYGWHVDFNNDTALAGEFGVYALCSTYPAKTGYTVFTGTEEPNPAGTNSVADAVCPSGLSVLGGGVISGSGATTVDINSTYPLSRGSGWEDLENNGSTANAVISPYGICAS